MPVVVQNFGGTSVGDPDASGPWPTTLPGRAERGHVVAVVTAMGKTTDDLVRLADTVSPPTGARERHAREHR